MSVQRFQGSLDKIGRLWLKVIPISRLAHQQGAWIRLDECSLLVLLWTVPMDWCNGALHSAYIFTTRRFSDRHSPKWQPFIWGQTAKVVLSGRLTPMIPITSPNEGLQNDKYTLSLVFTSTFWFSLKVRYYTQYYRNYVRDRLLPVCTGRVVHFYACIMWFI